jgi:hypothetical protein
MTGLDQTGERIGELINSCRETHEVFRSAAQTAANTALKRLFGIYAQQRSRFAEELGGFAPAGPAGPVRSTANFSDGDSSQDWSERDVLQNCLAREKSTLALYRKVVAERALPTRAHFLVSAQLALLERVHERIEALSPENPGNLNHLRAT